MAEEIGRENPKNPEEGSERIPTDGSRIQDAVRRVTAGEAAKPAPAPSPTPAAGAPSAPSTPSPAPVPNATGTPVAPAVGTGSMPTPQQPPKQTPMPTPQQPPVARPQEMPLRQAATPAPAPQPAAAPRPVQAPTQPTVSSQPTTSVNQPTQVRPAAPQPTQATTPTPGAQPTLAATPKPGTQSAQSVQSAQPTQVRPVVAPAAQHATQASQTVTPAPQTADPQQSYAAPTQGQAVRRAVAASQTQTDYAAHSAAHVQPPKPRKGIGGFGAFMIALLGGLLGAGALFAALTLTGRLNPTSITIDPASGGGSPQTITINPEDTDVTTAKAAAAKALPSVVSFQVESPEGGSLGSGVVINENGDVITNHHVVENATSIIGSIGDKSYEGKIVGQDPSSDLAVVHLELNGDTVTPIEIGDSDKLEIGDWVMTIGSPYGLDQSCSSGIVSSLYRSTMMSSVSGNTIYTNLIQTDAAINPGNSGGALVDNKGRLVGINSLNASYSGGSSGVGFAIPVNYAMRVADSIVAGEPVLHAYIGLSLGAITNEMGVESPYASVQGAYVVDVPAGGPADEAGIQKGDIITALDNKRISSADGLILAIREHNIGDKVKVTLIRDGEEMTLEATLSSDEALQGIDDISEDRREEFGERVE